MLVKLLVHPLGIKPSQGTHLVRRVYKTPLPIKARVRNCPREKLLTPLLFTLTGVSVIGEPRNNFMVLVRGLD